MKERTSHYGVIGAGDAGANVIEDNLIDTPEDATFYVLWSPEHTGAGMDRVYEWLIDSEAPFYLIQQEGSVPPAAVLHQAAQGVHQVESPFTWLVENSQEVFVLWSDEEDYVDLLERAYIWGVPCRDLTNGLVPIVLDDRPEPADQPLLAPPQEEGALTEDDIRSMPLAALRRVAKAQGMDAAKMKKDDLIQALLGTAPSEDQEMVVLIITSTGEVTGTDPFNKIHRLPTLSPEAVRDIFSAAAQAKPWSYESF